MAKMRLGNAKFVKRGYGQVEVNHVAFQRTGQIYAQLPAAADIELLENGQFAKYDYENKVVNFTGKGDWLMVFNEVKLYEDRQQYEDFAMIKDHYEARVYSPLAQDTSDLAVGNYGLNIPVFTAPGMMPEGTKMVPRLVKINIGDLVTMNTINEETLAVGDVLKVGADGYLAKTGDDNGPQMLVVKVYTMADGQPAVKLQCIA